MKTIIRLECNEHIMHEDVSHIHQGCYSYTGIAAKALDDVARRRGIEFHSCDSAHPTPEEDGLNYYKLEHMCAFSSHAMFRRWFPYDEGLQDVADIARVAVYSVDDKHVQQGKHQVIVNSTKVTLIKVLPTTCTAEDVEACIREAM